MENEFGAQSRWRNVRKCGTGASGEQEAAAAFEVAAGDGCC